MTINISLIKDNKIQVEQEIQTGSYILGREGDLDIIKQENGISREHGKLIIFDTFIMYKDLGSTNGSWIEGEPASNGQWKVASFPTFLQLANVVIGFKQDTNYIPDDVFGALIVFEKDIFIDNFHLNKLGKSLVIGGIGGNLNLASQKISSKPACVIETRQTDVMVYSISKELPIFVNGKEITGKEKLTSQDVVEVDNYIIYVLFFKENVYKNNVEIPKESEEERIKKHNNAEKIIKSLKSWEDGDFDATDVFKKKMAGKTDVFQKMSPLMPSELEKEEVKESINYAKVERGLFWLILIFGLIVLFFLVAYFLVTK